MNTAKLEKVIYQITVKDLQTVALETLGRELTEIEIRLLEEKIGDHIDWYGSINNALTQIIEK